MADLHCRTQTATPGIDKMGTVSYLVLGSGSESESVQRDKVQMYPKGIPSESESVSESDNVNQP